MDQAAISKMNKSSFAGFRFFRSATAYNFVESRNRRKKEIARVTLPKTCPSQEPA
jgi:hypothetical protein